MDRIFFALSDAKRRSILTELSEESKSVGELANSFDLTMGAVSKNIIILEKAGLIHKSKRGRQVYCHMNFDIWRIVAKFIAMQTKFWERRLNELESYIDTQALGEKNGR
ncbi:MAG: winged helix-turn-helix transcriptional regulator [Rhodospirillaceae bacterium]|nr:winged helix-turn-helix transcriptional regulator [Rhodospirillaceae bacterium]